VSLLERLPDFTETTSHLATDRSFQASSLDRKPVALVTGAARGIGSAVCRALVREGVAVAALDRDAGALRATVDTLRRDGAEILELAADVADPEAVERAVAKTELELGPIGSLASVAGVLHCAPVLELSNEAFDSTFDVNVRGAFYVCRSVGRRMVARSSGAIVAVGSNAASVARVNMAAYAASKAALRSFVHCLGLELAGRGVRCNLVSPGSTDTDMQRAFWAPEQGEREIIAGNLRTHRLGIPLGRLGSPDDVAEAVLFLLSDRARHITLHDLRVDGGATLGAT
jgi:2,3-dihydro-2,3-dihydroxybenzoate dehydrogenase